MVEIVSVRGLINQSPTESRFIEKIDVSLCHPLNGKGEIIYLRAPCVSAVSNKKTYRGNIVKQVYFMTYHKENRPLVVLRRG